MSRPDPFPLLLALALCLPAAPAPAQTGTTHSGPAQADAAAVPANPGDYRLGPREKLFVRIGHWDSIAQTYTSWPDASGEYTIGADGVVSIPMAGAVTAAGLTTAELALRILEQLEDRMGSPGEMDAAVEVLEYRPVYVIGEVQTPGAIPFAPGMNVIEALGRAGGLRRPDMAYLQGERSALASLGNHEVMRLQLFRHLATVARLEAELATKPRLEARDELATAPAADDLLRREAMIKAARDSDIKSRLAQIASLEKLLQDSIASLSRQFDLRGQQLALAQKDLTKTSELVERGLTVASRRSDLQAQIAEQEVRRLELETARLDAEQRLSEVRRERVDILNAHKKDILDTLNAELAAIAELRVKIKTEAALYAEAMDQGEGFVPNRGFGAPTLELARRAPDGRLLTATVGRDATLMPGDVLEVRLPLPDDMLPQGAPQPDPSARLLPDTLPTATIPPAGGPSLPLAEPVPLTASR